MKAVKITVVYLVMVCLLASCAGSNSTKALFLALQENSGFGEIEKQLERGADVNAVDEHGKTPLHYAVERTKNRDIIIALIRAGADVNAADSNGRTPLDYSGSNLIISITLIDAGANIINISDVRKQEMLFDAIDASSPNTISALIASGVDVNEAYDNVGKVKKSYITWRPLQYAVVNSAPIEVIIALINAGADVNFGYLLEETRDIETLTALIKAGIDANAGRPLASLVSKETTTKEMVEAMIEAGADVNLGTPLGNVKDIEILKVMIKAGANVNVGRPLRSLVTKTTTTSEMIAAMIEAGADVNLGDPLRAALNYKRAPDIITKLTKAGADANTVEPYEGTPLGIAIKNNLAKETIFALIEAGAYVNPNQYSKPLFQAVEQKDRNLEVISALIKAGADVNSKNSAGWRSDESMGGGWGWNVEDMTPLMRAIEVDASLEIITTLVESGARVNAVDSRNWSPLIYAATSITDPRVISLLVKHRATVNYLHTWNGLVTGMTPLMHAANASRVPEVIDALLDGGADAKIVVTGKKAIDYAKKNEYLVNTPAYKRLEALSL